MSDKEVMEAILAKYPDLKLNREAMHPCKQFEHIASFAISLIDTGKITQFSDFASLIDNLYSQCMPIMAIAIENVFVYKLGTRIELDTNRQMLIHALPTTLQSIILKQLNSTGI